MIHLFVNIYLYVYNTHEPPNKLEVVEEVELDVLALETHKDPAVVETPTTELASLSGVGKFSAFVH